jgi:hypothetical protein
MAEQDSLQDEQAVVEEQVAEVKAKTPQPNPPKIRQILIETDGSGYKATLVHAVSLLELQAILSGLLNTVNQKIQSAQWVSPAAVAQPTPDKPGETAAVEDKNDG